MPSTYLLNMGTSQMQMVIQVLITFFLTPFVIGTLGRDLYGVWVLLNSIMSYFSLGSFGFMTTLVKDLSEAIAIGARRRVDHLISSVFFGLIAVGLLLSILVFALYSSMDVIFKIPSEYIDTAKNTLLILYLIFLSNFLQQVFFQSLFAAKRLYVATVLSILTNLLIALSTFVLLSVGYSIVEMAFGFLLVTLALGVVTFLVSRKMIGFSIHPSSFRFSIIKEMAGPSSHYFIIGISVLIVFNSDNIVISSFVGVGAVASYSIAFKVIDTAQTFVWKIVDVLMPNIAMMNVRGNYRAILSLHNRMVACITLIILPLAAVLYVWGIDIIAWWVGPANAVERPVLSIFIAFMIIHAWVHVSSVFIAALGVHRLLSYVALFEGVLNLLLSLALVAKFGVFGVAIATLITHIAVTGWFAPWWFYRNLGKSRVMAFSVTSALQNQNRLPIQ
jgi:O-antigen/teichoic acid export membrane protein